MCDPEERRFSVVGQSFSEGGVGRTNAFRATFSFAHQFDQPDFTRRDQAVDGRIRTLSRIHQAIINVTVAGCVCKERLNMGVE